ncbi:MAG: universal stress protein [Polyangia bacterium]
MPFYPVLRAAERRAAEIGVDLRTDLRVAHSVKDAIIGAVRTHRADLLVMGWKGFTTTRDRIFGELIDYTIRHCPCDLALAKVILGPTRRILLATSGGPNATLGAELTRGLAEGCQAAVDSCVVVDSEADAAEADAALELDGRDVGRRLIRARSVAGGIVKTSRDYDLVVIGAAPARMFKSFLVGEIPEKVARFSPASVILIRRWQGPVAGLFRRLFG